MTEQIVQLLAPAKINLFLHVTGRRDDGYHELESLFVFTDFGDRLFVRPDQEFSLDVAGPFSAILSDLCPNSEDNLLIKAARSLEQFAHDKGIKVAPVHIPLEKNIPIAAGVGGGSADAAALLQGLINHWELEIDEQDIHALALELGADVPACLSFAPKWVTGIGEDVKDINSMPKFYVVLVNPCVPLSTPEVFAAYKEENAGYDSPISEELNNASLDELVSWLQISGNSLQPSAKKLVPEISEVLDVFNLDEKCKLARMSGSGPTCFGVFETIDDAESALEMIEKTNPDWWAEIATVMGK